MKILTKQCKECGNVTHKRVICDQCGRADDNLPLSIQAGYGSIFDDYPLNFCCDEHMSSFLISKILEERESGHWRCTEAAQAKFDELIKQGWQ